MQGKLYFIPVTLGSDSITASIPQDVIAITHTLDTFIVENEKTARRFLGLYKHPKPIREITFHVLNEHTQDKMLPALLNPLFSGINIGLMSEAGCPGIADPGAKLAELAHKKNIQVIPLVGPSSILLSLMASGLNGQRFTFLGYLPSDKPSRLSALNQLEKQSNALNETQIFIETPYRNQHMLDDILTTCKSGTRLCIACNIGMPDEYITTKSVEQWKQINLPELNKKPTVFLLLSR
jgi:16S rRNA (cytidine1402-2'-O)-methyltransferase